MIHTWDEDDKWDGDIEFVDPVYFEVIMARFFGDIADGIYMTGRLRKIRDGKNC